VIETDKRGDWWYGATAAFPKAVEWQVWTEYWRDRAGTLSRRERFLVDATVTLHQLWVKMAQRVRKNIGWTRNYTEDEMAGILAVAEEKAAWYRRNRPSDASIRDLDPRLLFMFQALDGAYAVAERLANELDQINRKGFVMVDTSSEVNELAYQN
jgi:hypothetical protein